MKFVVDRKNRQHNDSVNIIVNRSNLSSHKIGETEIKMSLTSLWSNWLFRPNFTFGSFISVTVFVMSKSKVRIRIFNDTIRLRIFAELWWKSFKLTLFLNFKFKIFLELIDLFFFQLIVFRFFFDFIFSRMLTSPWVVGLKLYSEIYQNFRLLEKFFDHRVRH